MKTNTDFDFILGDWTVSHRRLNARLCGCTEWTSSSGLSSTRPILGGFGNVEDNILNFPDGQFRAAAFRSFDPSKQTWAIWWLDGKSPHHLDIPVVGGFLDGVGRFYASDTLGGKPIKVRFIWTVNINGAPTWEQAFSEDNGETWETNWTMTFEKDC